MNFAKIVYSEIVLNFYRLSFSTYLTEGTILMGGGGKGSRLACVHFTKVKNWPIPASELLP